VNIKLDVFIDINKRRIIYSFQKKSGQRLEVLLKMNNQKTNLVILVIIIIAVSLWNIYLINELNNQTEIGQQTEESLNKLEERITQLNQDLSKQKGDKEQLLKQINDQIDLLKSQSTLNNMMIEKLNEKGVDQPKSIVADLLLQSELIPFEGVLGGTMYMSRAWLLTDRYALAEFEDGHVLGNMILIYDVENGDIRWTVLDAQLEK